MRTAELLTARARAIGALLLAAGAVGACAGVSRVGFANISPFYTTGVVRYASGGGAMPLVTHGQPFAGVAASAVAGLTARHMRLPGWFPPTPFQPAPVEGAPSGNYRTVLVFNPAQASTDGGDACGPLPQIETSPPGAELRIVAAFCTGSDVITDVRAAARVAGQGDPGFDDVLSQVSFALFPPRNPLHDNDRRGFLLERPWR